MLPLLTAPRARHARRRCRDARDPHARDHAARTYFLAEGATGSFFDTDILIANPHDIAQTR